MFAGAEEKTFTRWLCQWRTRRIRQTSLSTANFSGTTILEWTQDDQDNTTRTPDNSLPRKVSNYQSGSQNSRQSGPRTWNKLYTLEHDNSSRRGNRLPVQITWLPREAPRAPNARWHRSSPSATTVQLPPREASAEQAGGVGAGSK